MTQRKVTYSEAEPTSPNVGDGWIHTTTRIEKIWDGSVWFTLAVNAVKAVGIPLNSGKNITITQTLTSDLSWSGDTIILTAGTALTFGQLVTPGADSKMEKALATGVATMPAIALATGSIAENATGDFLLRGVMRDDSWSWTPRGLLYVSRATAGVLTQTLPALTGEQVQVLGIAITATIILFNPSFELVEVS